MERFAHVPWWPLGDLDQFRDAVQNWLAHNWSTDIAVGDWWRRLAHSGLAVPTWDRAHGGLGATTLVQSIVEQELASIGAIAPPTGDPSAHVVGPALRQFASEEQLNALLPPLLEGTDLWALLLFDPCTTDPAATAVRAELDWKWVTVSGDKQCSQSSANRGLLLARTSGEGEDGLTWLLVDVDNAACVVSDGVMHIGPIRMTLDRVLGEPDRGWPIARSVLPYLDYSLSGRIRRGLVNVLPGRAAGNLDRLVSDLLADHQPTETPHEERRRQGEPNHT